MSKPRLRRLAREGDHDKWLLIHEGREVRFIVHWIDVLRLGAPRAMDYYVAKALRSLALHE
jgi:hypothetical protein